MSDWVTRASRALSTLVSETVSLEGQIQGRLGLPDGVVQRHQENIGPLLQVRRPVCLRVFSISSISLAAGVCREPR